MATLVLAFFALFILPFYLRSKVNTMPEFLKKRYDRKTRYVFFGFTICTAMFPTARYLWLLRHYGRRRFSNSKGSSNTFNHS